jgi:N-acetylglucosaminyl-diphospho-decaprenol L-rhamnosyltransferase
MHESKRPKANRVTVIVVTFNSAHCIATLSTELHHYPHVIIVDNASVDETLNEVERHLPNAQWVALEKNMGFGAANNLGVKMATTEFVLLLNPDCSLHPGAVAALVETADEHQDAAAVGPQLIDRHGKPDLSYRWRSGAWQSRGSGASGVTCVGFFSGACMLIRRTAMCKVGGFDDRFFLYYEDDDLCLRLLDECGPLLVQPRALVKHASRGSVGGRGRLIGEYLRGFHHIQSKFLFQAKHYNKRTTSMVRMRYGFLAALETALRVFLLDFGRACRCAGRVAGSWKFSQQDTYE